MNNRGNNPNNRGRGRGNPFNSNRGDNRQTSSDGSGSGGRAGSQNNSGGTTRHGSAPPRGSAQNRYNGGRNSRGPGRANPAGVGGRIDYSGRISRPSQLQNKRRRDSDGDIKMATGQLDMISNSIETGSDVNIHSPRDAKMGGYRAEGQRRKSGHPDEVAIIVTNWNNNNAQKNKDGGLASLIGFMERKSGTHSSPPLKLRHYERDGKDVIIWVREQDAARILHLNGFTWSGVVLEITRQAEAPTLAEMSQATKDTKAQMEKFLNSRYNEQNKFLNLSAISGDPILIEMGLLDISTDNAKSKFFPALMKIADLQLGSAEKKRLAVSSVSLANNNLDAVSAVTALAITFPDLKNLDLSNNNIGDIKGLIPWRWKLRHLSHLIISGNPVESLPEFKDTMLKWYPKLRRLNQGEVRTAEQVVDVEVKLPLAILAGNFRDEAGIAEMFVKDFFTEYDTNRASLANKYYDSDSTFSLSVNTAAPRASSAEIAGVGWDPYIKDYIKASRNLLKITHLPTRVSRAYTGTTAIRDMWASLPKTQHPDLFKESNKYNIECHSIPGLPDPNNPTVGGVGGLIVTIHGEFQEFDPKTNQALPSPRSFDRTFVLGPSGRNDIPVRVLSDVICLRAWGGFEAWLPNPDGQTHAPTHPEATNGMAVPEMDKPATQLMMEKIVLELSQKTGLNLQYSRLCLESAQWNPERAMVNFANNKDSLPADAWL